MKESLMDRWNLIVMEYTQKSAFAQAELHTRFMDSKCPDKGNVCEFLDELHVEKEKLATYSVTIKDKDYCSTIISSLPNFLSNFALSLLANVRLHAQSKTVDPDQLISLISEEYDHSILQCSQHAKPSKSDEKDKAMLALLNGKGKQECKPCGVCWNCGEKGHFKDKCPKPVKDMKNDSPKKGRSANTAVEDDSEDEATFSSKVTGSLMMISQNFALCPTLILRKVLMPSLMGIVRGIGSPRLVKATRAVAGKLRSYSRLMVVSAAC
jgi:gag-polypeptide of LTR copia-type/Zinc knuckle